MTDQSMTVKVEELSPHPLSAEIFGDQPVEQFEALKADIEQRGLQHPLEVDQQNQVICGSRRLRALQELGWSDVEVVKHDLTEEQVTEHLLKDNLIRRQLTPRQLFLAGQRLESLYDERRLAPGEKMAELVAGQVGMSPRQYQRLKSVYKSDYVNLVEKVDSGELSVSAAAEEVAENNRFWERVNSQPERSEEEQDRLQVQYIESQKINRETTFLTNLLKKNGKVEFGRFEDEVLEKLQVLLKRVERFLNERTTKPIGGDHGAHA